MRALKCSSIFLICVTLSSCRRLMLSDKRRIFSGFDVHHIMADNFIPGNLLLGTLANLITVLDGSYDLIAGHTSTTYGYNEGIGPAARFFYIRGAAFMNETSVICADHGNHCLRTVDRLTNATQTFFGLCGTSGNVDGTADSARFKNPITVVLHDGLLYLIEAGNQALRVIDMATLTSSTLYVAPNSLDRPLGLTMNFDQTKLFINLQARLAIYQLSNGSVTYSSQATSKGFKDGNLSEALFDNAQEITFITPDVLIVADRMNYRLRLVNLKDETVSSICDGTAGEADGSINDCKINQPMSVFMQGRQLYVGTYGSVSDFNIDSVIFLKEEACLVTEYKEVQTSLDCATECMDEWRCLHFSFDSTTNKCYMNTGESSDNAVMRQNCFT